MRLQRVTVGHRDGLKAELLAIEQHRLLPVVDRGFAFEEPKQPMAYLQGAPPVGTCAGRTDTLRLHTTAIHDMT